MLQLGRGRSQAPVYGKKVVRQQERVTRTETRTADTLEISEVRDTARVTVLGGQHLQLDEADQQFRLGLGLHLHKRLTRKDKGPTVKRLRKALKKVVVPGFEDAVGLYSEEKDARCFVRALKVFWPYRLPEESKRAWKSIQSILEDGNIATFSENEVVRVVQARKELFMKVTIDIELGKLFRLIGRVDDAGRNKDFGRLLLPNGKLTSDYKTTNPVRCKAVRQLAGSMVTSREGKHTVVPPFAGLIVKAVHALRYVMLELEKSARGGYDLRSKGLTFQRVKNQLMLYLEQVIMLTRVSRGNEAHQMRFDDCAFKIGGVDQSVPVIVGAFLPDLLKPELVPNEYYEVTYKGKHMQQSVELVHDMFPKYASMISLPDAISLVATIMLWYHPDYLDPTMNKGLHLFVKKTRDATLGKFRAWESTDSKTKAKNGTDRSLNENFVPPSVNDFSPYASRYLVAHTCQMLRMLSAHDRVQNSKVERYIRSYQFGHEETSLMVENAYGNNSRRLKYSAEEGAEMAVPLEYETQSAVPQEEEQAVMRLALNKITKQDMIGQLPQAEVPDQLVVEKTKRVTGLLDLLKRSPGSELALDELTGIFNEVVQRHEEESVLPALAGRVRLDLSRVKLDLSVFPGNWAATLQAELDDIHRILRVAEGDDGLKAPKELVLTNIARAIFHQNIVRGVTFQTSARSSSEHETGGLARLVGGKLRKTSTLPLEGGPGIPAPKRQKLPKTSVPLDDDIIPMLGEVSFILSNSKYKQERCHINLTLEDDSQYRVWAVLVDSISVRDGEYTVKGWFFQSTNEERDINGPFRQSKKRETVQTLKRDDFLKVFQLDADESFEKLTPEQAEEVAVAVAGAVKAVDE